MGTLSAHASELSLEKSRLEDRYSKLAKRFSALAERCEKTRKVTLKYRDSQDAWIKYADSLEAKIRRLEKKLEHHGVTHGRLPTASSATKPSEPRPTEVARDGTNSRKAPLSPSLLSRPEPNPTLEAHEDTVPDTTDHRSASSTRTGAVSQHLPLEGVGHRGPSVDEETLDEPKGAHDLPPIPPYLDTESEPVIKEEPSSDGPIVVSERVVRKRKHEDDEPARPALSRRIKSENLSSDPVITGEAVTFSPHESIDLDGENRSIPTPRKRRLPNPLDAPTPLFGTNPGLSLSSAPSTRRSARTLADRNQFIGANWTLNGGIADVAEETSESFFSPKPREHRDEPMPARGRLHTLLNYSSPELDTPILRPSRQGRGNLGSSVKGSPAVKTDPVTPAPRRAQGNADLSRNSRLRDRPLSELRVEDFKVNPKYNDGYKYAFDEVVRNKEERAGLAGCTDPNCCGKKFRAMAESELSAGGPGVLSRVADTKMMENYLGDEAYRLIGMTREERQELWLKAKTQDLADRYGRHRHRYARRPSPPGYWNPDFPSTQEIEKNKAEAEKLERGIVEQRWREAMRGGGRWLFRDE